MSGCSSETRRSFLVEEDLLLRGDFGRLLSLPFSRSLTNEDLLFFSGDEVPERRVPELFCSAESRLGGNPCAPAVVAVAVAVADSLLEPNPFLSSFSGDGEAGVDFLRVNNDCIETGSDKHTPSQKVTRAHTHTQSGISGRVGAEVCFSLALAADGARCTDRDFA